MSKFCKKPVVIEARQLDGKTLDVLLWMQAHSAAYRTETHPTDSKQDVVYIKTLEGEMRGSPGDWIIKGVNGEFYPCKPDIFAKTYEPAD